MAFQDRIPLIQRIEQLRQSTVICYLTSVRPNLQAQIAEDVVRVFFEHMALLPSRPVKKLDLFLCSNGGSGTVPWRLISLFREYAESVGVLIPFRAYSAATLLALGADDIVMHPFAEMGPIDPTVSNDFNPVNPQTNQRIGISVEDVKAYLSFVKTTAGVQHEDEFVKALEILAQKVHPLALGNVERFIAQSRMIARKILLTHMKTDGEHKIDEIIEMMASKLYFHGHPINRREAREELGLKVNPNVPPDLESAIWQLYQDFEAEMQNRTIFDPMGALFAAAQANPPPAGGPPMPAWIIPPGTEARMDIKLAVVESVRLSTSFDQKKRYVVVGTGGMSEPIIRDETQAQGWLETRAPALVRPAPQKSPPPSAARRKKKA